MVIMKSIFQMPFEKSVWFGRTKKLSKRSWLWAKTKLWSDCPPSCCKRWSGVGAYYYIYGCSSGTMLYHPSFRVPLLSQEKRRVAQKDPAVSPVFTGGVRTLLSLQDGDKESETLLKRTTAGTAEVHRSGFPAAVWWRRKRCYKTGHKNTL